MHHTWLENTPPAKNHPQPQLLLFFNTHLIVKPSLTTPCSSLTQTCVLHSLHIMLRISQHPQSALYILTYTTADVGI